MKEPKEGVVKEHKYGVVKEESKEKSAEKRKMNMYPKIDYSSSNHDIEIKKRKSLDNAKAEELRNYRSIAHAGVDHAHHNHITHSTYMATHMNESLVLLHSHSSAVAAQFRSIYPRTVKMWFANIGRLKINPF